MKKRKALAWLLSIAMAVSSGVPVYANESNIFSEFEEIELMDEDFEEEKDEDEIIFEEETAETDRKESDGLKDEELLETESDISEQFWTGSGSHEGEVPVDEDDLPSNEALFAAYVDGELGVELFSDGKNQGNNKGVGYRKLSGDALTVYKNLRQAVSDIADGRQAYTEVVIPLDQLNTVFTGEQAGIQEWDMNGSGPDIFDAMLYKRYGIEEILYYLLVDCPYELYWFDKTEGIFTSYSYNYNSEMVQITNLSIVFVPAADYSAGEYMVDTDKTSAAKNAAANAKTIAAQASGLNDYEKLLYYKNAICELTDYNDAAGSEDYTGAYGDPWQLIHVFDGDPSTQVVCEGYAKAFQYLYALSSFAGDIESYIVTGDMTGGTGAGAHMWNIVRMEDHRNYIVDVTNCDEGTIGEGELLFLAGTDGSVNEGYRFDFDALNYLKYQYDTDTTAMYTTKELTLADKYYDPDSMKEDPKETESRETETKETKPKETESKKKETEETTVKETEKETNKPQPVDQVEAFVTRMYEVCLNRTPDSNGLKYWTTPLKNQTKSGLDVAKGFVYSNEFQNKDMSDEQYITYMYKAFLGRNPDQGGMKYWLGQIAKGKTRDDVFLGFADSNEFERICNEYGIVKSFENQITQKDPIESFVIRLYSTCLNRTPDAKGLKYWVDRLRSKKETGRSAAHGFIFSNEFINRKYSDEKFVEQMYKAFFGRTADAAGKTYWMNKLKKGTTREQVFDGFVVSKEFGRLCDSFGIARE